MVLFGRDLRALSALQQRLMNAQASLEEDYSRLRDAEMRYRLLFQTSSEAVLVLEPARGRVVERTAVSCVPPTQDRPCRPLRSHTTSVSVTGWRGLAEVRP